MAQQSSRLDIIIDSRTAKQNADQLRVSLDAITAAGTKAATSAGKFGTAANAAAAEIARLNAAATAGAGSNSRFGSSAAAAAAEVARLNASTAAGAANNARFGAAATAAAAAVAALKAQSAASTATIVRMGAASDAATAAIVRLDRANGSAIVSSRGLTASSSALGGALGGIGAALAAKEILSLTDRYKTLQGQLALVSSSNAEAAQTFETLRTMSNNTGSSLEATVKLYTRFSNATRGAGFSQDQLLKATDAVNKAFLVSSATTQEATAASVQLSQAMASGVLRGEELNSVMEQAPRITRALSEYLGVATGQIRAMAAEGKITSDIVMNALLKSLSSLNKEVATMPLRFEQASQALKNNFLAVIGQVNVDPVIDSVKTLADTLADPKASEGVQSISSALVGLVSVGADGLNVVLSNVDALIALTGAYAAKVGVGLVSALSAAVAAKYTDIAATVGQITAARSAAAAQVASTGAVVRAAQAEAALTGAKLARANVEAYEARNSSASMFALQAQTAAASANRTAHLALAEAKIADTAAQNALNAANSRSVVGAGALTLLGGPMAAITLALTAAAGAYLYFSSSADTGTASLIDQNMALGETIDKFKSLSAEQQRLQKITWAEQQAKALEQASSALDDFAYKVETGITLGKFIEEFRSMIAEVEAGKRPLDSVTQWIEANSKITPEFRKELAELAVAQQTNSKSAVEYGEKLAGVNAASQVAAQSADALKFAQRESAKAAGASAATWDKYIEGLTKSRDLVGANAAAEAAYTAVKMGANAAQQEQARAIANQTDLLEKYKDAVKTRNTAEMESLRIQITAAFTAVRAAEDAAEAKKKADLEAAQSAEDSATRQVNAMQRVIDKSVNLAAGRNLLLVDQPKQALAGGVDLLTNGKGYTAPAAAKKTVAQEVQEAFDRITTGVIPNKAAKTSKGPSGASALSAAMSTFDALYKKAEPAANAIRTLTKTQEQLELAQSKGKITQEQYGVAMAQASRDYAAVIAKTGELAGVEKDRIEVLRLTGQAMAANDAQSNLDNAAQIAEYERQGNFEAIKRLGTLKQIRDINLQSALKPKTVEGVSEAPDVSGLDASVGGATSEIARLNEESLKVDAWRAMELEKQKAYLDLKAINEETYAERINNINQQGRDNQTKIEQAKNQALLSGASDFFGNMSSLSQSENSKLTAIGKAAAIAQATISTYKAANDSYAALAAIPYVGPALGFAAAAAAITAGLANVASIAGVGFSGGGYTGPGGVNEYAGAVHKGEVVWSQDDIRKFGGVASVEALRRGEALPAGMSRTNTSSSAAPSGKVSAEMNVSVHNYAGAQVETQRDGEQMKIIIKQAKREIARDLAQGNGEVTRALTSGYGLRRAAR